MTRVSTPMRAPLRPAVEPPLPRGAAVRGFRPADGMPLGPLMADAYSGTVDDHGEPAWWYDADALRLLDGVYGRVAWGSSLVATDVAGRLVGASIVTHDEARWLLAFALVAPQWRRRGLGTALLIRSANRLAAAGAAQWTLAVTEDNPARRLYERLGFVEDRSLLRPAPG